MNNIANLPKSIAPCPIVEATLEIRYESKYPTDAIIGVVYNVFSSEGVKLENLPILQIPEEIRKKDPNLQYKPTHRMTNGVYNIQIGGNVILLTAPLNYPGWIIFNATIESFVEKMKSINVIEKINFVGLRYLDFFKCNIFDNIKLQISLDDSTINYPSTAFKSQIKGDGCLNVLQILNDVHVKNVFRDDDGSLIEITSVSDCNGIDVNLSNVVETVNALHIEGKKLFFSLLKDEFLEQFTPKY